MKTKLGLLEGLGPGHIVLDGDPSPPKGGQHPLHNFRQMAGQIKMPLGMEVGFGPGDFVLDGDPAPPPKKAQSPNFLLMCIVAKRLDGSRCLLVWR